MFINQIVILVVLLALSAFFSGSETALFSLTRFQVKRLHSTHPHSASRVSHLLKFPRQTLITLLVGNTLVNIAATSIVANIGIRVYGNAGVGLTIGLMTFLILVFGEVVPKQWAIKNSSRLAVISARPLELFRILIFPLWAVLRFFTGLIIPGPGSKEPFITQKELKTLINLSEKDGTLDEDEKEMIHAVFDFGETLTREIMVPRVDLVAAEDSTSCEQLTRLMKRSHHTRIPIYEESIDNILGVIRTKDFLLSAGAGLKSFIRPVLFTPETKKIDDLFVEFQAKKQNIAVVVDEYGGTAGLITLEDILEEIVGEIYDEYDKAEDEIKKLGPNTYRVSGKVTLKELNDELEIDLPSEEADTLAGFLLSLFNRFPADKEKISYGGIDFTVEKMRKNRIRSVIVKLKSHKSQVTPHESLRLSTGQARHKSK